MSVFFRGVQFKIIEKIYLLEISGIFLEIIPETQWFGRPSIHPSDGIDYYSKLFIFSTNDSLSFAYEKRQDTNGSIYKSTKSKSKIYKIEPQCSFPELINLLKSKPPHHYEKKWSLVKYYDDCIPDKNIKYLCREGKEGLEVNPNFMSLLTPDMFSYYKVSIPLREFTGIDLILWPFLQKIDDNDIMDRYELYEKKTKVIEYPLNINDVEKYLLLNEYKIRLTKDDKIIRDPCHHQYIGGESDNIIVINDTGSGYEFIR